MKKYVRFLAAMLCFVLLCCVFPGCVQSETGDTSASSTQLQPTETEQLDDGKRTVRVTTQGGMAMVNHTVTIYADEALSQQLDKSSTDGNGMAYFKVEPGTVCYAVAQGAFGFAEPEAVVVTEALTHIQLVSKLVDPEERRYLQLGDIMYDLDYTDWNGNPYRVSDAIAAGKHSIIVQVGDVSSTLDRVLPWLQTVYEDYGDQLCVVILCGPYSEGKLRTKMETLGITIPAVTVLFNTDWLSTFPIVTVVDRYGMLVFEDYMAQTEQNVVDALVTYLTAEEYQQHLFTHGKQLVEYLGGA